MARVRMLALLLVLAWGLDASSAQNVVTLKSEVTGAKTVTYSCVGLWDRTRRQHMGQGSIAAGTSAAISFYARNFYNGGEVKCDLALVDESGARIHSRTLPIWLSASRSGSLCPDKEVRCGSCTWVLHDVDFYVTDKSGQEVPCGFWL